MQNGAVYAFFCDKDVPINTIGYYLIHGVLQTYSKNGAINKELNKILCTLTLK